MLNALYKRILAYAGHKHAVPGLAGLSFIESSIFPIPPDVMLLPMCLARRDRAFYYALVCTIASVLGGIAGYGIGYFLFETVATPIIEFYGKSDYFSDFTVRYNTWGAWAVLIAGVTPFPYKVITIASGLTKLNLGLFILFSCLARGIRFFLLAFLIHRYGASIQSFIERYLPWLTILFFVCLFGGFYLINVLGS